MILIFPRLFIGDEDDSRSLTWGNLGVSQGWSILHAAKEPYHRAFLGYKTRGAPEGDEHLVAARGHRMALNLIDADDKRFISPEMISAGLAFINHELKDGRRVLVHCNQGISRAPGIVLMWLKRNNPVYWGLDYAEAKLTFMEEYFMFAPGAGIEGFLKEHWNGVD